MVFGLALMLALLFGVASAALGANGGNFILGQNNTVSAEIAPELTGQEQEVESVSLTAPTDGFVLVHSNYDIVGVTQVCPCTATMHLRHGTDQQSFSRDVRNHDATFNSGSISWVFPVTAGSHSFKLFGRTSKEDVFVVAPTIQALFTPFGSTDGGSKLCQRRHPKGTRDQSPIGGAEVVYPTP